MWTALDIFIGLALCYALVSLFCSALQEFIAQAFNSRGKFLVEALKTVRLDGLTNLMQPDLVNNPGMLFANLFKKGWGVVGKATTASAAEKAGSDVARIQQDIIKTNDSTATAALARAQQVASQWRLPHDIPADVFARALLARFNLLANGELAEGFKMKVEIAALPPALQARLVGLIDAKQASVDTVISGVSEWYKGFTAQVEHWYTRRSQVVSLLIGLAVAVVLNVDTFAIVKSLRDDPAKRAAVVEYAKTVSDDGGLAKCPVPAAGTVPAPGSALTFDEAKANAASCYAAVEAVYPFALGWDVDGTLCERIRQILYALFDMTKLLGILLSGLALSLGSRFWFDTLKGLLALRTGGTPAKTAA